MKWIFRIFKLTVFAMILALIFHNFTARAGMAAFLRWRLGVPVSVGEAKVDFLNTQILFRDILIKNPYGFPEGQMAKIPYLILDLEPGALFEKRISLYSVEADISEIQLVILPRGEMNWSRLKPMRQESGIKSGPAKIQIHHFYLTLRRATVRDLSRNPSQSQSFNLVLDKAEYLKVRDLEDMVKITAWESLKRMNRAYLGNGILDRIREDLEGTGPSPVKERGAVSGFISKAFSTGY